MYHILMMEVARVAAHIHPAFASAAPYSNRPLMCCFETLFSAALRGLPSEQRSEEQKNIRVKKPLRVQE